MNKLNLSSIVMLFLLFQNGSAFARPQTCMENGISKEYDDNFHGCCHVILENGKADENNGRIYNAKTDKCIAQIGAIIGKQEGYCRNPTPGHQLEFKVVHAHETCDAKTGNVNAK